MDKDGYSAPPVSGPEVNYFICTLGQASRLVNGGPSYPTINVLVEEQAKSNADSPAIGFYQVQRSSQQEIRLEPIVLTWSHVQNGILGTAERLINTSTVPSAGTVALLSASSVEFFFTWLACLRLGLSVLLIAPECSASGVASLCSQCHVQCMLVDDKNFELARAANGKADISSQLEIHRLPFDDDQVFQGIEEPFMQQLPWPNVKDRDVAYFHHTSGTSSGTPKPIPQTHRGAVGVLPSLDGQAKATFTTTPLFHGGPADIFRAWTSNAMIWLYPSNHLPVTATIIHRCLESASQLTERQKLPPITYFATVPYILQILTSSEPAMKRLRHMDLVSVGGAALPQETGDGIVRDGINLVSRFGSAECGFLLSSHRMYDQDQSWQYLRLDPSDPHVRFEERADQLYELVVASTWPHMAKRNRDDGSYATADLFERHPCIPNAWRFHSRADAQLTLVTGKKFDPAPIEDSIISSSDVVRDALVFGNERPYPGILVFRSEHARDLSNEELRSQVSSELQRIGKDGHVHARIAPNMVVCMPYEERPLEKSSKGTILRRQAEQRYQQFIDNAYAEGDGPDETVCSDEALPSKVKEIIAKVMSVTEELDDDTDLFAFGMDSMASIHIRNCLQKLLPRDCKRLSNTVVEDCLTTRNITKLLREIRSGNTEAEENPDADHLLMQELVEKYTAPLISMHSSILSQTTTHASKVNGDRAEGLGEVVLLTGSTGSLGSHVLTQLLSDSPQKTNHRPIKVYLLIRAPDYESALTKQNTSLRQRNLPLLSAYPSTSHQILSIRNIDEELFSLDEHVYQELVQTVSVVIHLAWKVNFRLQLRHLEKDCLQGLAQILKLVLQGQTRVPETRMRLAFCSSVAAVAEQPREAGSLSADITDPARGMISETWSFDPADASPVGYSKSKWVAEAMCRKLVDSQRLDRDCLSVWRVGQLSGDRVHGAWSVTEAWPLLLSTVKLVSCLPDLGDQVLGWLPVDSAAQAMVQGILFRRPRGMFHIVQDHGESPTWRQMLGWLRKKMDFETVTPTCWVEKMQGVSGQEEVRHKAMQLLDHWKESFGRDDMVEKGKKGPGDVQEVSRFATTRTKTSITSLNNVGPVDEKYFEKLWTWIDENVS